MYNKSFKIDMHNLTRSSAARLYEQKNDFKNPESVPRAPNQSPNTSQLVLKEFTNSILESLPNLLAFGDSAPIWERPYISLRNRNTIL